MIWTTVVLAAALAAAPEDKDKLTLSHVRDTHGLMGPTRTADKLIPGGELFICFDIDGVTIDDEGKVHYSIAVEVADPKGKVLFKQEPEGPGRPGRARRRPHPGLRPPRRRPAIAARRVHRHGHGRRSAQQAQPGAEAHRRGAAERLRPRPRQDHRDPEGQIPVAVAGAGEGLWISFGAVGFGRGGDAKQPDLTFEMRVLDEAGKPVRTKPYTVRSTRTCRPRRRWCPRSSCCRSTAPAIHGRTDRHGQGRAARRPS